jgi:Beta-propeller repeat
LLRIGFLFIVLRFFNIRQCLSLVVLVLGVECVQAQKYAHVLNGYYGTAYQLIDKDADQNVYLTGYFSKYLKMQKYFLEEKDGKYFCLKYDPAGRVQWVLQFDQPIKTIKVKNKHLYLAGQFVKSIRFDTLQLNTKGNYDTYLAQLSLDGKLNWIRQISASEDALTHGITLDSEENIYLTGGFVGTLKIDDFTLQPIKLKNIYLIKFNVEGKSIWAKQASAGDYPLNGVYVWGIHTDSQDNILLTGSIIGAGVFGSQKVSSSVERFQKESGTYNNDAFLAKYTPKGELLWVRNIATHVEVQDITSDEQNAIYLTGYFRGNLNPAKPQELGTAIFDQYLKLKTPIDAEGHPIECMFVAKYSSLGNLIWVKQAQNQGKSRGIRLEIDKLNREILVAGFFNGTLKFNEHTLQTQNPQSPQADLFLARYQSNGALVWAKQLGGSESENLGDLLIDESAKLYLVGVFRKEADFGEIHIESDGISSNGFMVEF